MTAEKILRVLFISIITFSLGIAALIVFQSFSSSAGIISISLLTLLLCIGILTKMKPDIGPQTALVTLSLICGLSLLDYKGNIYHTVQKKYGTTINFLDRPNEKPSEFDKAVRIEMAKDDVRDQLKDPKSAKFRNTRFAQFQGTPMVCGEVNSRNSFGGMSGYQHFVATGESLILLEEQAADFHVVWNKVCR